MEWNIETILRMLKLFYMYLHVTFNGVIKLKISIYIYMYYLLLRDSQ